MAAACRSPLELLSIDFSSDVERLVQPLKEDRDLWKARAQAYKAAFDSQSRRLSEAIDLCVATRVELENVRLAKQLQQSTAMSRAVSVATSPSATTANGSEGTYCSHTLRFEDASEVSQPEAHWQSSSVSQQHFGHVEELVSHNDLAAARKEIDRILPGRLSNEARVEGLLLKSAICRASGSEWVLEALAQCSEALTLSNDIKNLKSLLPKIHYHRGLCLLYIRQLDQARATRVAAGQSDSPFDGASTPRNSFNESEAAILEKRRPAFDEHRTITEGFLSSLKEGGSSVRERLA